MKNKLLINLILTFCLFSCSQKDHSKTEWEIILDSAVTKYFGEKVYMDMWERLWIVTDNRLTMIDLLEDTLDVNVVELNINSTINNICWLDNNEMMAATDSGIILLTDTGYTDIAIFPYPKMNIAEAIDNKIYLWGKSEARNEYDISLADMQSNITRLFSSKEKITDIAGNGTVSLAVLEKKLMIFSHELPPTVIVSVENEITSIAVTDFGGIFVATSKNIGYFEDVDKYYVISNTGAKKLWYRNKKLYVLLNSGDLLSTEFSKRDDYLKTNK